MPRDLPLSNGRLHLNFDETYTLRDVYYPHVGQENHTNGHLNRFGVWVDGRLSWLNDSGWQRSLRYEPRTLVTDVTLTSDVLQLQLTLTDAVDLEHDLFVRKVRVTDQSGRHREIRLFQHFDGYLWGYRDGDTAYFEPGEQRALVHYKGKRYLWFSGGVADDFGYQFFATGNKGAIWAEGTWRDAEDGRLGENLIAQGSVDSIGGFALDVPACGEAVGYFWMAAGYRHYDVLQLHRLVVEVGPAAILARVRRYWHQWVQHRTQEFGSLPERVVNLYHQSLLILRTQIDHQGAILAANDSDILQFGRDTYSYMWPRDGALVCLALDGAGYSELTERFFRFAAELITQHGFFLHKYNPDGSAGSSWHPWSTRDGTLQYPIQEDETALVLLALWHHYERFNDIELIRELYGHFIVPSARFLSEFRDQQTGLPLPSYDLWEERHGVHAFTIGAVWAGLRAAAKFARIFADDDLVSEWSEAADAVREAALTHLYQPEWGRFARTLRVDTQGSLQADPVLDSSLVGLFQFGMLSPSDPRVVRTMQAVEERLWCKTPSGGMARYVDDYYHQVSRDIQSVPGNPWFICTLWLADWYLARGVSPSFLSRALELLEWAVEHALPSGVLAEQVHPDTNQTLSVSPLTWSHATFVSTVLGFISREGQMAQSGWDSYLRG